MAKKKRNRKTKDIGKNDYKKDILILVAFFVVVGIVCSTIINSSIVKNKKKENQNIEILDLKEFVDVDLAKIFNMINDKRSFVLYIGYKGCKACEDYSPILKRVQSQNGSDTYYLNYKSIDKKSKNWKKLTNMIDVEQKITISKDGENVRIDDKIGNIMYKYGYTPVTILFVNGECKNAHIGSMGTNEINSFLGY